MADYYVKSDFPIISAITKANPGQVTTDAAHGLTTGDVIAISGVGGMTQVNNLPFTVTVVDSTNFTIGVDTTGYTTYTGAGYVHKDATGATYRGPWLASHAFAAGARVISNTVVSLRMHECTTGGTSGAAQPTFNTTVGNTTADNTVTWTTRDPTTWANATLTLLRTTPIANSDTVYLSHQHREVYIGGLFVLFQPALRNRFLCVNDGAEPPTTLATTAVVESIGNTSIYHTTGNNLAVYFYGIEWRCGTGNNSPVLYLVAGAANRIRYEKCTFDIRATGSDAQLSASAGSRIELVDCSFKFGNASQGANASASANGRGRIDIDGGVLLSGTAAITTFAKTAYEGRISGMDFSNAATAMNIFAGPGNNGLYGVARNCKMPSGWTGDVVASGMTASGQRFELYNCDASDTNYRVSIRDAFGQLVQDTGIYNNSGATNGATRLSWKAVTTSNAQISTPSASFITQEIVRWNETTGSAITATVQILHDSATALKDNEVWLEVQYLGTSGVPLGTFLTDGASAIASGTNQASSSATWTAPGITNANTQQLSVTFTPQEKGFIHAKVYVAKASYTVYIDPLVTIS